MGDVVLSAGVRQNLLALQSTAELMSLTQNRLATGKKVNSALDNPFNFFTSQSLSNRARDLNALLDSIGQAQQTIAAADHGITAITKLVESAKAVAKQAQQITQPTSTYALAITGNTAIPADVAATGTGSVSIAADTAATLSGTAASLSGGTMLSILGVADGDVISVSDGTNTTSYTVGTASATTLTTLMNALGSGSANVSVGLNGINAIEIVSDNAADTISISSTGSTSGLGFGAGNTSAEPANATIGALTGILTVQQGSNPPINVDFATVNNRAELLTALGGIGSITGAGNLVLTASNNTDSISVTGTGTSVSGLGLQASYDPTNATIGALTGSLTVQVGAGATQTINFGAGNVTNRAQLTAALAGLTGVTATINGSNQISITSATSDTVTIGGTGTGASGLFAGANIGINTPTATTVTPDASRATLQIQFNDLLAQIDGLARDASYNGINLLYGDDLVVTFNEDGSSSLNITGVLFTSGGLGLTGLTAGEFQSNAGVDTVLGQIDTALKTLRSQASNFGSKLGTVQTRQDFTKKLIQTLETGADNLVLADTNEEGANMLALQTRQQLSTTALSLSAQADQAVLRLFG